MSNWKNIDSFFMDTLVHEDDSLTHALTLSRQNKLPEWEVSAQQGQFLYILAKMNQATRILEIGTLGGYSTIWLARALPQNGAIISLEYESTYADVAKENIKYARLSDKVTILEGDAADSLRQLIDRGEAPFDMIFIDADKPNNPLYLELALRLSKKGTVIFGDNVVRDGALSNPDSSDPKVQGVRQYIQDLGKNSNLVSTGIQTVGCKGYDGFTISIVE